jgi:hypothetical protein
MFQAVWYWMMIGAGDNIRSVSHFILTTQCTWVVSGEQLLSTVWQEHQK